MSKNSLIADGSYSNVNNSSQTSELFEGILCGVDCVELEGNDVNGLSASKSDKDLMVYLGDNPLNYHSEPSDHTHHSGLMKNDTLVNKPESMCMSKNAVHARENRQKKKEYIQNLEKTVDCLKVQNSALKNDSEKMQSKIVGLVSEVEYLKGVIANQSTLAKLIGSMCQTPGLKFYSSFSIESNDKIQNNETCQVNNKRKNTMFENENQENNKQNAKRINTRRSTRGIPAYENNPQSTEKKDDLKTNAGVCLHVSGEEVSLEFCSKCSESAISSRRGAHVTASGVLKEKVVKRKK